MKDGFYSTDIHSFTKNKTSTVIVSEEFLNENDTVLIIDDFLANGDASLGLYDIAQQAKAKTVGIGIVVEKEFPDGRQKIRRIRFKRFLHYVKLASLKGKPSYTTR